MICNPHSKDADEIKKHGHGPDPNKGSTEKMSFIDWLIVVIPTLLIVGIGNTSCQIL